MRFPRKLLWIPGCSIVYWYGWRDTFGDIASSLQLFEPRIPWCIKGPLWNWCWRVDVDWRASRAKERAK